MLVVIVLTCIRYYEILVLIVSTNLFGLTNINFHFSSTVYLHVYNSAPDRTPGNRNRTYIVVSLLLGTVQSFWIGNTLVVQDESNTQLKLKNKKCLVYWVNLQYLLKMLFDGLLHWKISDLIFFFPVGGNQNFSPLTHSGTHTIFLSKGTLQHAVQSTTIHIFWEQLTPPDLYPACFSNSESSRFKTRLNLFVTKEYELSLYCIFGFIWFYGA